MIENKHNLVLNHKILVIHYYYIICLTLIYEDKLSYLFYIYILINLIKLLNNFRCYMYMFQVDNKLKHHFSFVRRQCVREAFIDYLFSYKINKIQSLQTFKILLIFINVI